MKNENQAIIIQNTRFSKALKEIDTRLKFKDDTQNYFKELKRKIYQNKKNKEILDEKTKNHEDLINNLKRAEQENIKEFHKYSQKFKNNFYFKKNDRIINLSTTMNNFSLPKIKYLKSELQDNEKNENYELIRFENVWKAQQINRIKFSNDKRNKSKTMYNYDFIDIFDKKYDKYKKHLEESKEKNIILKRIKSNNLKVDKKVKIFRYIMLKFQDQREYFPNYSILEKHQPEVKLNTKSKRIFPEKFIKKTIYKLNDNNVNDNNENKKNNEKIKRNSSDLLKYLKCAVSGKRNYRNNNPIICENDKVLKKDKFFLSSIDIKDNRYKPSLKECNNKNKINYKRNNSCLNIKRNNINN